MEYALKSQCLCGSVTVEATPLSEQLDACHCEMCRKWSGGPYMAIPCGTQVSFVGEGALTVYQSSEWGERVFCRKCGTILGWRLQDGTENHVSANLFRETETFPFKMQVFIDEKPENYSFAQETEAMTGPEIFAMLAPTEGSA